jgi:predicted membrane protein DUF2157
VLSYERELTQLRPLLGDPATDVLIARERREVFSIYPELRIASWAGVLLLATAAGIVLKNNLDRIGPLALAIAIGLASAACYAWVWWRRARASLVDDYVLLLGALLLSACVGFVESQFRVLGDVWQRHLFFLAIAHGVVAYAFRSRMVLSLSITAFAAWLGIEQQPVRIFTSDPPAAQAILCAAILLVWRAIDRRLRPATDFSPLFEHFAANLGLSAGVALMVDDSTRVLGCLWTIALAAGVIVWGVRTRRESFVLYAFLYGVIAVDVLVVNAISDFEGLTLLFIVLSTIAAIIGLILIHSRMKDVR